MKLYLSKASKITNANFTCLFSKNCVKFFVQRAALNSKFALFLKKILREISALFIFSSFLTIFLSAICITMEAQNKQTAFQPLPFGSIKPTGWLATQMQKDVDGFVGHLDQLVPALINDPIYGAGRLQKHSKAKDLGNNKEGDVGDDEQYKWWNSETQSNWWDAYIRNVFLVNDRQGIEKVNQYVKRILATQDDDGYIGIYDKELRYKFQSENGELWSKTTLYRGLLAYYEATNDEKVLTALKKAVDNVMLNYPIGSSSPFSSGTNFNGGVSHGLTFTDVLDRMYYHTKDKKYWDYALFLYRDFSKTHQSEEDVQLKNILNPNYKLKSHGVHTFEHLRPLIVANYASGNSELQAALQIYIKRLQDATTITGGAIGDEWIAERKADATHTGYEYCSLQESLDSYALLLQKSGNAAFGDAIENLFYNAAQGARNPKHSCIAYLKTDNSFEMLGTKNGEVEPSRKQVRYKYSPAHQEVAVCCSPNAGRISPYFIQNSWMRENENTLVATLLLPNRVETTLADTKISIENQTNYPNENHFLFKLKLDKPLAFKLKIRKPSWAKSIITKEKYRVEQEFIVIDRKFETTDEIKLSFETDVLVKADNNNKHYFSYGALIFAKPINAKEIQGKIYTEGFSDYNYEPISTDRFLYVKDKFISYKKGVIQTKLINQKTKSVEKVALTPIGTTILRQVTF